MQFAIIVSILFPCIALNAQTIQGKVVHVADGDTITIIDEAETKKVGLWKDANPIPPWDFWRRGFILPIAFD